MTIQRWHIRYGNIAAAQYVTSPDGTEYFACGMDASGRTEYDLHGKERTADIPVAVRARVVRRFAMVFAYPAEERGKAVKNFVDETVEV